MEPHLQNRTEQKVYFHINTLLTNICDRLYSKDAVY